MGPQFGDIAYISEVNIARKVKSDAQVAKNKNSDTVQKFFLGVAGEKGASNSNFSKLPELSETSRTKKLIFGLEGQQSQISRDRGRWHIGALCPHH